MDISKKNEPFLNTLHHYGVCQKVSIYFDAANKHLKYDIYFNKSYMWGNGL
jgi:hypothetical protein